ATVTFDETQTDGACASQYTLTRTWTATDECGNETVHTQTITVQDTTAPTFNETLPADVTVECDAVPTAETLTASDNCDANATVTFDETQTDGACASQYTLTRTWTATDECGNETIHTQTITVQDTTAPTFTAPADITIECDVDVTDLVSTGDVTDEADNCAEDLEATYSDAIEDGSCPNEIIITRTWTLTDDCGNEADSQVQIITVQDTTAPSFNENLPSDLDVECDAVPEADILTASDNCDSIVDVVFNEEITNGGCVGDYLIERTWTAIDSCGNESIHIQIITVSDNTAPALVTPFEEDLLVSCDEVPDAPNLIFEDNCSNDISVSFNESSTQTDNIEDYVITRTWTVTDDCGNTIDFVQTVTVEVSNVITPSNIDLCIEDLEIDLFDLLSGEFNTNGTWTVVSGNAIINDSFFDPSTVEVGDYTFLYSITDVGCPAEAEVTVSVNDDCVVLPCGAEDVIISKTVTANGDMYNEFFTITGVEDCGFVVELQIFNRWGAKIYENNNYQNNWNGEVQGSSVGSSGKVPTGTYYYIINLRNSGLAPFNGPIYVATDK
ncbi:MAG: gliding motility-associated C-terminal domain-containing protein, partial [Winogradskyella sp.]|uniref:HYR-like domain-containing protein n=1 Tax=Winogradskyella sp. TaxID=1883156 RepID=UPI0025DFF730